MRLYGACRPHGISRAAGTATRSSADDDLPEGNAEVRSVAVASACGVRMVEGTSAQILDEDDFVLFLVVDELIDAGSHRQHAEAAGAQALRLADQHVVDRVVVCHRGVIEIRRR